MTELVVNKEEIEKKSRSDCDNNILDIPEISTKTWFDLHYSHAKMTVYIAAWIRRFKKRRSNDIR